MNEYYFSEFTRALTILQDVIEHTDNEYYEGEMDTNYQNLMFIHGLIKEENGYET